MASANPRWSGRGRAGRRPTADGPPCRPPSTYPSSTSPVAASTMRYCWRWRCERLRLEHHDPQLPRGEIAPLLDRAEQRSSCRWPSPKFQPSADPGHDLAVEDVYRLVVVAAHAEQAGEGPAVVCRPRDAPTCRSRCRPCPAGTAAPAGPGGGRRPCGRGCRSSSPSRRRNSQTLVGPVAGVVAHGRQEGDPAGRRLPRIDVRGRAGQRSTSPGYVTSAGPISPWSPNSRARRKIIITFHSSGTPIGNVRQDVQVEDITIAATASVTVRAARAGGPAEPILDHGAPVASVSLSREGRRSSGTSRHSRRLTAAARAARC